MFRLDLDEISLAMGLERELVASALVAGIDEARGAMQ